MTAETLSKISDADMAAKVAAMEKLLRELLKCRQINHVKRKVKEFLR